MCFENAEKNFNIFSFFSGDHKQLRPRTATYQLATKYLMEISLFERLINNNFECPVLQVQHRMRPEISALVSPNIYEHLENHCTVLEYGSVLGVKKNLFFLHHAVPEQTVISLKLS